MENTPLFPSLTGSPFGDVVGPLAFYLFTQTHLIWTKEEIENIWKSQDSDYVLLRQHYEFMARAALDFLDPILSGQ